MDLQTYLTKLKTSPQSIEFDETMSVIDGSYNFKPSEFRNGETINQENQNNGSCKIFAFAQLHQLDVEQTLACFGRFYREDVLQHPENSDHQNIRNFMCTGWEGVEFQSQPLSNKA